MAFNSGHTVLARIAMNALRSNSSRVICPLVTKSPYSSCGQHGPSNLAAIKQENGSRSFCSDMKERHFLPGFDAVPELQSANKDVQRIFSLSHAYQREQAEDKRIKAIQSYDDPLEKSIAKLTVTCGELLRHCQDNKKDKSNKVFYIFMLDQRKKKLKRLKEENPERYFKLIDDLGLPALKDPNAPEVKYKSRKYKRNVPLIKKRQLHEFEEDRMV